MLWGASCTHARVSSPGASFSFNFYISWEGKYILSSFQFDIARGCRGSLKEPPTIRVDACRPSADEGWWFFPLVRLGETWRLSRKPTADIEAPIFFLFLCMSRPRLITSFPAQFSIPVRASLERQGDF